MASAPSLKHYSSAPVTNVTTNITGAVGAARALVVSKITVANLDATSSTFDLMVGAAGGQAVKVASQVTLAAGQVYTETGLVVLTGESVFLYTNNGGHVAVNVFGEEVDN